MGYHIDYGLASQRKSDGTGSLFRIAAATALFFLLFCMIIWTCWPEGREVLCAFVFPGGGQTTIEAAEVFVYELKNGEPIKDALTHFCREILYHGDIP